MNAKKIMGAVLVAFLAAALFIGAGAAADDGKDFGTVFIYQNTTESGDALTAGEWINGDAKVVVTNGVVYPGANFAAGTYKNGKDTAYFTYPTANYAVGATIGSVQYLVVNGGNVYNASVIVPDIESAAKNVSIEFYLVTLPSGKALNISEDKLEDTLNKYNQTKGTYKVQAIFSKENLTAAIPNNYLLDANALTYTVVGEDDATLAVSADTLFAGESLTVTVKGTPGTKYAFVLDGIDLPLGQFVNTTVSVTPNMDVEFIMPNNGEASFQASILTGADDEATIGLYAGTDNFKDAIEEITIAVSAAQITATLGASSYFVGDTIVISGTSTAGIDENYNLTISGVNFKKTQLEENKNLKFVETGKTWEVEINTAEIKELGSTTGKMLDVGTYTITIEQGVDKDVKVFKTISVALKQPFISIVEAPEVIVQGTEAKFTINAEATTEGIQYYVFGTNFFIYGNQTTHVKDISNQFVVTLNESVTSAENMSTGQYFMVFQHPMYDEEFNIQALGTGIFLVEGQIVGSGSQVTPQGALTLLFNVNDRQTANAAQALCDALDSQNIDDMYVKYSFFVVGKDAAFTISDIPATIAQGETLTISGTSTANEGDAVTVEMLSTAFAAVPKETVGSAAFITVTTEVAKDGTWEVTLDTSDLNIDEYSLKVVCGDDTWKNVKINVVEAADEPVTPPTDEPGQDEPGQDEPVAPETPGFGALAALAGLGAVAVLLLRRE